MRRIDKKLTPYALLLLGYFEFVFVYLIQDKLAQTSSIYTYYQNSYYLPLSHGKLPWIDFFVEYPAPAAFAIIFPAFIAGLSVFWVSVLRGLFCALCSIAFFRVIDKSVSIADPQKSFIKYSICAFSVVTSGYYFGLWDWYLLLSVSFAAIAVVQNRINQMYYWLGFGAAIKLIPLLSLPFLVRKEDLNTKSALFRTGLLALLVNLPFVLLGLPNAKLFITYHANRGLDCNSLWAVLLQAGQNIGLINLRREWRYGALEVVGPYVTVFAKLAFPSLGALLLIMIWWRQKMRFNRAESFFLFLAYIPLYVALSKVSQNSYVTWLVGVIVAAAVISPFSRSDSRVWASVLLCLVTIGWFQDRMFHEWAGDLATWRMISASLIRHLLCFFMSWKLICYALESKQGPSIA